MFAFNWKVEKSSWIRISRSGQPPRTDSSCWPNSKMDHQNTSSKVVYRWKDPCPEIDKMTVGKNTRQTWGLSLIPRMHILKKIKSRYNCMHWWSQHFCREMGDGERKITQKYPGKWAWSIQHSRNSKREPASIGYKERADSWKLFSDLTLDTLMCPCPPHY